MPLLLKALLLVAKSKRGRELLLAAALGGVELARSERGRAAYARAWAAASSPRAWEPAAGAARGVRRRLMRR